MKKSKIKTNKIEKKKTIDYFILVVFLLSMFVPLQVSLTQKYIVQYGDDIAFINWAQTHPNILSTFTETIGTGYRPMMLIWIYSIYNLFGTDSFYYYFIGGIIFSLSMIFLYLLGKILHSQFAGIIAVLIYLLLDHTFIMVAKLNFFLVAGEILFITSALYYSIHYYKTKSKTSMYLGIILSVLAFLNKEPSLLIIPCVNIVYLLYNKMMTKRLICVLSVPFIYMFIMLTFFDTSVGTGGETNLLPRIIENLKFYIDTEINVQFKTPILLGIVLILSIYLFSYKNLKEEVLMCLTWIIVGVLPFLITRNVVQPTYLLEANLGTVLLAGIVISEGFKKINIITGILIIGILMQLAIVPVQVSNMQNYNKMVSDNQNTFFETVTEIKNIPETEKLFYFSGETRNKYGGYQIPEEFFIKYLCMVDICKRNVTTNYNESNYIILPSTLDIQIFQKEYVNETKLQIIKQIQHNNDYGIILKK